MTPLLLIVSVLTAASLGQRSSEKAFVAQGTPCKAVLEVQLPVPDSMLVPMPVSRCGAVRLVLVAPPRRVSTHPWWFNTVFAIPVAIQNVGSSPITLPVAISADSITPVQRGRQLSAFYAQAYVEFRLWDDGGPERRGRFPVSSSGATALEAGEQTEAQPLIVAVTPLAQGFRVWVNIRGAWPEARHLPLGGLQPHAAPLEPAIRRFVRNTRFANQRAARVLYRDRARALQIFQVEYGKAHDCVAGCFYSNAIGMAYEHRVGWMRLY